MQQAQRVSLVQQPDGDHIIHSFAVDIAKVLTRVAPILGVIRSAAETDSEMAALYRELHQTRRRNLGRVVDALQERGLLRAGVTVEEVKDTLWSVVSPELWLLREGQLGTSEIENSDWISAVLRRTLRPLGHLDEDPELKLKQQRPNGLPAFGVS